MGNDSTNYIVSGKQLNNIGNAIISKGGASSALTVDDMPDAIRRISTSVSTKSLGIYEQTCNVDDRNGNIIGYITIHCDPKEESGYVYVPSDGRNPSGEKIHITSSSLKPGNIKNGVKIMGVTGTYKESSLLYRGSPEANTEITVNASGPCLIIVHNSAWSGYLYINGAVTEPKFVEGYRTAYYVEGRFSFRVTSTPAELAVYKLY